VRLYTERSIGDWAATERMGENLNKRKAQKIKPGKIPHIKREKEAELKVPAVEQGTFAGSAENAVKYGENRGKKSDQMEVSLQGGII